MPFIAGAVSVTFGTLTLITGDAMWVQIKVTLFNALVALLLWIGLQDRAQLLPLRVRQDLPLHRGGLDQVHAQRGAASSWPRPSSTRPCAWASPHAHIIALNRVFTGVDIWILFKIFIIMPVTALFFWWQVRVLQKYRLPEPIAEIAPRSDASFLGRSWRCGTDLRDPERRHTIRESTGMNEEANRPGIAAPPNPHASSC